MPASRHTPAGATYETIPDGDGYLVVQGQTGAPNPTAGPAGDASSTGAASDEYVSDMPVLVAAAPEYAATPLTTPTTAEYEATPLTTPSAAEYAAAPLTTPAVGDDVPEYGAPLTTPTVGGDIPEYGAPLTTPTVGGDVPEYGAPLTTPTEDDGTAGVPHYEILEVAAPSSALRRAAAAARFVTLDRPFEAETETETDPGGVYDKATDMAPGTDGVYSTATDVPTTAGDVYDQATDLPGNDGPDGVRGAAAEVDGTPPGTQARSAAAAVALCKYVSATGRPCKNKVGGATAAAGGEHCKSHTCGAHGCTQPKSSKEPRCPLH